VNDTYIGSLEAEASMKGRHRRSRTQFTFNIKPSVDTSFGSTCNSYEHTQNITTTGVMSLWMYVCVFGMCGMCGMYGMYGMWCEVDVWGMW